MYVVFFDGILIRRNVSVNEYGWIQHVAYVCLHVSWRLVIFGPLLTATGQLLSSFY